MTCTLSPYFHAVRTFARKIPTPSMSTISSLMQALADKDEATHEAPLGQYSGDERGPSGSACSAVANFGAARPKVRFTSRNMWSMSNRRGQAHQHRSRSSSPQRPPQQERLFARLEGLERCSKPTRITEPFVIGG
jgi:hypothetical protein